MAFLAFLRAFLALDMAVEAKAVHCLVSLLSEMARGALFFALGVVLFMMALLAFQTLFFMHLVRHPHRSDLALVYGFLRLPFSKGSGCFGNGDYIGRHFSR